MTGNTGIRRRRGFTLIELLVVIAIIGVLLGMTAVVVTGVYKAQAGIGTEATIQKAASELDRQWKAVIDAAKEEFRSGFEKRFPTAIKLKDLKAIDPDRARRLYVRLRIEQEFPHNFTEVRGPGPQFSDPTVVASLPRKQSYVTALAGQNHSATEDQSAACLIVVIEEGRRGAVSNLEEAVGPSALKVVNGSRMLLDSWGMPIAFRRVEVAPKSRPSDNVKDWLWEVYSAGPDKNYATESDNLTSLALRQLGARGDQGHD